MLECSTQEAGKPAAVQTMKTLCDKYIASCNRTLAPLGLTQAQSGVLLLLYRSPSRLVDTEELLQILQVAPPSLSSTLRQLEQKGYIHYAAVRDVRKKTVSLTVKALKIQNDLTAALTELEHVLFHQISAREYGELCNILQKMTRNLDQLKASDAKQTAKRNGA